MFLTYLLYPLLAYVVWYIVSRLGLLGAWLYSKPGSLNARHYVFMFVAGCPLAMEIISTTLVIFSVAFGFSPRGSDDVD